MAACAGRGAGAGAAAGEGGCRTGANTGAGDAGGAAASTGCGGAAGGRGGSAVTGENGCSIVVGTKREVFSTRLPIEPVMSSTLFSSTAIRASSRSRSAVSTRTVSASSRPSTASSGRAGLMPDGTGPPPAAAAPHAGRGPTPPRSNRQRSPASATPPRPGPIRKPAGNLASETSAAAAINAPIALSATFLTAFRVIGNCLCRNLFVESISRFAPEEPPRSCRPVAGAFFRSTARI